MMDTQGKIKASHLARKAYLYVRQSTLRQVSENTESTRRQYALHDRAVALGWSLAQIEVIDCDLGHSAASASDRQGFQHLVSEVSLGHSGIVLGLEVSRLARNCSDWHRLLEICALTDTLILDEDGLYEPTDFNDRLLLGIKGTMSEAELHLLRARLRGGLLTKAKRGELRTGLPVGFVYKAEGGVTLHPDAQVQGSLRLFFDTFRRTGSVCATVKYFNAQSLSFPRLARLGLQTAEIFWRPLTLAAAVQILHNPRYAGAFAYGRRRSHKQPNGNYRTNKVPREQWHALVYDAHPGYISFAEYEEHEQCLARSSKAFRLENRTSIPREGPALLQGLALCGVCGSRMTVRYHDRSGILVPTYICHARTLPQCEPSCQIIAGAQLDLAVGQLLLRVMSPMAIELTLSVQVELEARFDEADRLRQKQVERAEYEVELAKRRYMQVDPSNRLVASTLEADWNEKLCALKQVRDETEKKRDQDRATLDKATKTRIRDLAQNFPSVFTDPATLPRDRKRIAALLIEDITLLKGEQLTVNIRFRGGATETLVMPLPQNAWQKRCTPPDLVARIEHLLLDHDVAHIAELLNAKGLQTGAGLPFNADAVRWICYNHKLKNRITRRRETGKLTVAEMAVLLGRSDCTIRSWARQGLLNGSHCELKPTWLFDPIEKQSEAIRLLCAQTVSPTPPEAESGKSLALSHLYRLIDDLLDSHDDAGVSQQLNTRGIHTESGGLFNVRAIRYFRQGHHLKSHSERRRDSGLLTSADMAVCLGRGISTIHHWATKGLLIGIRYGRGDRPNWLFHPIAEQSEKIQHLASARAMMNRVPREKILVDSRKVFDKMDNCGKIIQKESHMCDSP
jgi:DNA invertase Pin-like site-specific DNA recombinase